MRQGDLSSTAEGRTAATAAATAAGGLSRPPVAFLTSISAEVSLRQPPDITALRWTSMALRWTSAAARFPQYAEHSGFPGNGILSPMKTLRNVSETQFDVQGYRSGPSIREFVPTKVVVHGLLVYTAH
jgi:hypothetical protein